MEYHDCVTKYYKFKVVMNTQIQQNLSNKIYIDHIK